MANIAFHVPHLQDSILLLLQKCLNDSDDEVRERAYFYFDLLSKKVEQVDVNDFFNFGEEINIEELERYVTENREELTKDDSQDFCIDLS